MTTKLYFLLFACLFCKLNALAQTPDSWTSFWNIDSTLIGFKDRSGAVKIQPKFQGYTNASKWDYLVAVTELHGGNWSSYYLTKPAQVIGKDSLYIFDNAADCESEGFIRFRDPKTDLVGLFNRRGKVVVPAVYNALERVKNGLLSGLKGAEKKYWDSNTHSGCHHFSWSGGQSVLLDTLNNLLIEDFPRGNSINYFSLEKTTRPMSNSTQTSYLAQDGSYYSFVDFEREFQQWINTAFTEDLTIEKLLAVSHDSLTWESQEGWATTAKEKLIADNFKILKSGLLEVQQSQTDYFISIDGLNPYLFGGETFEKYFDNCGMAKDWKYPCLSIVITHREGERTSQNHYEFLRTDQGYKLICLTIRDREMK